MTVLESFDEELVSDAGRSQTLEASTQLSLDDTIYHDEPVRVQEWGVKGE